MFKPARKVTALLVSICVLLTGCGHGPGPDDTIRNAYAWYVRELKSGVNPLEQKRTELQQFVTEGFLTSIDNMPLLRQRRVRSASASARGPHPEHDEQQLSAGSAR